MTDREIVEIILHAAICFFDGDYEIASRSGLYYISLGTVISNGMEVACYAGTGQSLYEAFCNLCEVI